MRGGVGGEGEAACGGWGVVGGEGGQDVARRAAGEGKATGE